MSRRFLVDQDLVLRGFLHFSFSASAFFINCRLLSLSLSFSFSFHLPPAIGGLVVCGVGKRLLERVARGARSQARDACNQRCDGSEKDNKEDDGVVLGLGAVGLKVVVFIAKVGRRCDCGCCRRCNCGCRRRSGCSGRLIVFDTRKRCLCSKDGANAQFDAGTRARCTADLIAFACRTEQTRWDCACRRVACKQIDGHAARTKARH